MSALDVLPGVLAVAVTVIAVLGLMWLSGKTKVRKEVMFMRPRDRRGETLDITRETDRSVMCEKSNPIHRFIKIGPAWTFKDGGKLSHRFLGIEGSAYTAMLKNAKQEILSVEEYLRSIWGDKNYNALPHSLKDTVEKDKVGITIDPVKIDPKEQDLPQLSSDDVNDEGDATILGRLAKIGSSENIKQKLLGNLLWMGLGFGLAAVLANWGLF